MISRLLDCRLRNTSHRLNYSKGRWLAICAVLGCTQPTTLEAHIYSTNAEIRDEYIIPACNSCNELTREFCKKDSVMGPDSKQKTYGES